MEAQRLLATLREQLAKMSEIDFYRRKFQAAGVKPKDILTMEDFRRVPFTMLRELENEFFEHAPPFGGFFDERVARINFTQTHLGLMPVLNTRADIELMNQVTAASMAGAGLTVDDTLLTTQSSHVFPAGSHIQGAVETLGAKIINMGPGETERTIEVMRRLNIQVIYANPSFALKLAERGMRGIRILFGGGEPFSSVKGLKDKMRQTLGNEVSLIDSYAIAHCMPLARECRFETGLHILEEVIYLEIIDPQSGEVLPEGTPGEVVVTHLHKQAMPLIRYRTGDLSVMRHIQCPCGRSATLVSGVLGRADSMVKIKGVKVYPDQIKNVLRSYPDLSSLPFQIEVSSAEQRGDRFVLKIKASPPADQTGLLADLKNVLLIRVDDLRFEEDLPEGPVVNDHRY